MSYNESRRAEGGGGGGGGGGSSSSSSSNYPVDPYSNGSNNNSNNTAAGSSSYPRLHPYGSSYPPQQQQQHQQQSPRHTYGSNTNSNSNSQSQSHNYSQHPSQPSQSPHTSNNHSLPYGYDYNLPIFPYGYPHMSGGVDGSAERGGGGHANGSNGGGAGNHSPNHLSHSYNSSNEHSTMAPLPEHIESGIMSTSTWLLQPGGMPLTLEMDNHNGGGGQNKDPQGANEIPQLPASLQAVIGFAANTTFRPLEEDANWRIAVDSFPFSSGLEGISGLPLDAFHAAAAAMPPPSLDAKPTAHAEDVKLLETYLNELVSLMEPFALSPTNPTPPPPPPFLHTRLSRLGTLVRETLASLESRSQPLLSPQFSQLPPGDNLSEAEREMELIRRRRDVLIAKAAHAKRDGSASAVPRKPMPGRVPVAPKPRDEWRCVGCGATSSAEWKDGPDGPQSLCENCGYHYERLVRKRDGGDGDFSSVPAPGYNPNLMGMGQ